MSVLIKGMEMPKNYKYVDVRIFRDGTATTASAEKPFYKEMDVVEVHTPHGRLIDADALECHADNVRDPMGRTEKTVMWEKIKTAPTVIPADKDGET